MPCHGFLGHAHQSWSSGSRPGGVRVMHSACAVVHVREDLSALYVTA